MDGASLAVAVVGLFKDVYLTIKFVRKIWRTMKAFREDREEVALKYALQLTRLRGFWQVFNNNTSNKIDTKATAKMPIMPLIVVAEILKRIKIIFVEYSGIAGKYDEDYRRYCNNSNNELEHHLSTLEFPFDLDSEDNKSLLVQNRPNQPPAKEPNSFLGFLRKKPSESQEPKIVWKEIPGGFEWYFDARKLRKLVAKFKEHVDDLTSIPNLRLEGANYEKVQSSPDFKGRAERRKIAKEDRIVNSSPRHSGTEDFVKQVKVEWKTMQEDIKRSEASDSRILVEFKRTGNYFSNKKELLMSEREAEKRYVPMLASILAISGREEYATSTLPTLPLKGYARDPNSGQDQDPRNPEAQFVFAFEYPTEAATRVPLSLHAIIGENQDRLALNDRFHVAKVISRALGVLHDDQWLHKNINSHAIKFFYREGSDKYNATSPYLTEFELSRPESAFSAGTSADPTTNVEENIYRHPQRFGASTSLFNKIHDIYSLGVVLLELGLWKTARQMYDEMVIEKDHVKTPPKEGKLGQTVKEWYLELANRDLEHHMGSTYKKAVLLCLGGDWTKHLNLPSFADEFQNGVVQKVDGVGLRWAEPDTDIDWDTETLNG